MLTAIDNFFNTCTGFLFGPIMLCVFFGTGILMTVITRGVQFRKFGVAVRTVFGNLRKKEAETVSSSHLKHWQQLFPAVSATEMLSASSRHWFPAVPEQSSGCGSRPLPAWRQNMRRSCWQCISVEKTIRASGGAASCTS